MSNPTRPEVTGQQWPYVAQRSAPVGLGIASAVVAVVLALVEVATAVAAVPAESAFREALEEGRHPDNVFTLYDGLELLLFPVLVAAFVVSCLWLQSARTNTAAISPYFEHARSKVWVWLGWVVPIVNFWFPYQVVRDIRDGSRPVRAVERPIGLGLWWTAWLLYVFGNRIAGNLSSASSVEAVDQLSLFEGVTAVAAVTACVQWCRLVHRITTDQQTALVVR